MATSLKTVGTKTTKAEKNENIERPRDLIAKRESPELILAFSGPIGCGIEAVKERATAVLNEAGYTVVQIKLSDYIKRCLNDKVIEVPEYGTSKADTYKRLQDAGNLLRHWQTDILAEYAIQQIKITRTAELEQNADSKSVVPRKRAFLIDQPKHPDEVQLLRMLYGNLFYLIGVLSVASRRKGRLKERGVLEGDLSDLIERDRRQIAPHGQQLDKTLKLADFFIRNDHANADIIDRNIRRFVQLIQGANGITPTLEEYGMYVAFAAGLRSACLSRQVGASIVSRDGKIISTGRNDVQQAGGGLYGPESGDNDARCVRLEGALCFNDAHKQKVRLEIEQILNSGLSSKVGELVEKLKQSNPDAAKALEEGFNPSEVAGRLAKSAYKETRLSSLIEFSRSIHAEMDAITSLARSGGGSTQDASLFTYTFPCHNCARHIVAAGIAKVYFLEPYEKSLASELHWDAIDVEPDKIAQDAALEPGKRKVQFIHFEGVAPRQYLNMFSANGERKLDDGSGKAVVVDISKSMKKVPEYLDDYRDYEAKVVQHLEQLIKVHAKGPDLNNPA